jgi:hypothetical protein
MSVCFEGPPNIADNPCADFSEVPAEIYGTDGHSRHCPVRDVTLGLVATNSIVLNWVLTSISYREALSQTHDPASSPLVLRRRYTVYKVMNEMMNRDQPLSEDLMCALAFSGLVEDRIGGKAIAQMHLRAYLVIREMRLRQGFSHGPHMRGIICVPIFIQIGLLQYFRTGTEVRNAHVLMTRFFQALQINKVQRLQQLANGLSVRSSNSIDATGIKATHQQLRHLLLAPLSDQAPLSIRMLTGLMLILNLAVLELHQHYGPTESLAFLRLIVHCFQNRTSPGDLGPSLGPSLTGMLSISLMCIDYMDASFSRTQLNVWHVIDVIHLLRLGTPVVMAAARLQLLFWLLDDQPEGPEDLERYNTLCRMNVLRDIKAAWRTSRSPSPPVPQPQARTSHERT